MSRKRHDKRIRFIACRTCCTPNFEVVTVTLNQIRENFLIQQSPLIGITVKLRNIDGDVIGISELDDYVTYNTENFAGQIMVLSEEMQGILSKYIKSNDECCSCCPDSKPGEVCIDVCCPCS